MDVDGVFLGGFHIDAQTFEALFGMVVVMVMLRLELFRRAVNGHPGDAAPSADKYKKLLRDRKSVV